MREYLNRDWKITEEYKEALLDIAYDTKKLKDICIPHTCKETPFHYFDESEYQMISGYVRKINVPKSWEGKRILLTFEGIAHESEVFLNSVKIGAHHCGYTAFTIDISENLNYGRINTIVVKVDSRENLNIPPFGHVIDYMTYGGIYRDVYLDIKEPVYLADVFLHSDLKVLSAEVTLNEWKEGFECRLSMRKRGDTKYFSLGEKEIEVRENVLRFGIPKVDLWDIEHPNLYDVKVELLKDEKVWDTKKITFGFRSAEFKADGFYLNGKKIKIRGLNRHQSYAYVGYAMPESMQKLDADVLKYELGVNAVRTSHYPQSQHFIDRCDEIGLLVFTEFPGWQHIGDEAWKEQACQNVHDMVMQYRNHTSIILWGVRINESQDDDEFYQKTNEIAHKLDPTRQTGGVRNFKKSHLLEDVYTYNDFVHNGVLPGCEPKAKITSDVKKPYLVTEYNGHMFPTKSFDCEGHRMEHAIRHANVLDAVAGQDDISGSFGWCMFDYNTHQDFGSGDRICYHGVLDMFRNPKMAAAVYSSQQEEIPVLEISSAMEIGEYPASTLGASYIFSNADSIRMYKNDYLVKEYKAEDSEFKNLKHGPIVIDDMVGNVLEVEEGFSKDQSDAVKYILNAVVKYGYSNLPKSAYLKMAKLMIQYHMNIPQIVKLYTKYVGNWGDNATVYQFDAIKDGKVVKSIIKAPMKKAELQVKADHTELKEGVSYDVALVRIQMVSEYGNLLSFSHEPLILEVSGPIEIIGPKCITLQGGMSGVYVKTIGETGEAQLLICDTRGNKKNIQFTIN